MTGPARLPLVPQHYLLELATLSEDVASFRPPEGHPGPRLDLVVERAEWQRLMCPAALLVVLSDPAIGPLAPLTDQQGPQ